LFDQSPELGAHAHRVDRQLHALDRDQYHHLEQVPRTIRPDDKPAVRVLSGVLSGKCMVNSVAYVLVGDTVLARLRMDLHDA
jgi:hypothetical protein